MIVPIAFFIFLVLIAISFPARWRVEAEAYKMLVGCELSRHKLEQESEMEEELREQMLAEIDDHEYIAQTIIGFFLPAMKWGTRFCIGVAIVLPLFF